MRITAPERPALRGRLVWTALVGAFAVLLGAGGPALAQEVPTVLTDKVTKGEGVIDILQDVSAENLGQYFNDTGQLLLAIDVNEDASGNESSTSQGIAIASMELVITTSEGDFTFSDFYTSTTAMVQADGASGAEEYYTVFGTAGSYNITSGTSNFNISAFDDVIYMDDISFTGEILGASLNVTFLDTANTGKDTNESFFDYSNGFEDLAIVGSADASALEAANVGLADAPSSVTYDETPVAPSTPGAPAPPLKLLLGLVGLVLWKVRGR